MDPPVDGPDLHAAGARHRPDLPCHEGNYAIENTLRGARLQEAAETGGGQ
ncbi:MAG: hypothetical protein J4G16_12690 [Acidobacteria bacterium]|nr:hypothetical protein [Acidobacteriota bacterium]